MSKENYIELETESIKSGSASFESFKKLRTNLMYTEDLKVISVVSSIPDEGKTVIAFNLAYSFAQVGKKVCLVDCDLRRSSLKEYLAVSRHYNGISEVLTNQSSKCIVTTNVNNFFLVMAGKKPPNPSELLASASYKTLIERLKEHFDYIIIDTPPIVAGADATVVSRVADGSVFVIRNDFTSKKAARRAINELTNNGGRVVGVVLSRVNSSAQDYGHYGYYGYHGYY